VRRARLVLGFFARREQFWPAASEAICRESAQLLGSVPGSVEQMLLELRGHADLDNPERATHVLRLLIDLERRRMSLWPGLPRRAFVSCRRTGELTGRAAP
jgi:hypothetical protein